MREILRSSSGRAICLGQIVAGSNPVEGASLNTLSQSLSKVFSIYGI